MFSIKKRNYVKRRRSHVAHQTACIYASLSVLLRDRTTYMCTLSLRQVWQCEVPNWWLNFGLGKVGLTKSMKNQIMGTNSSSPQGLSNIRVVPTIRINHFFTWPKPQIGLSTSANHLFLIFFFFWVLCDACKGNHQRISKAYNVV